MDRAAACCGNLGARFFGVLGDPLRDAVYQRMRQTFFHRFLTPRQRYLFFRRAGFQRAGEFDQPLGRILTAVKHHILNDFAQLRREIVIHAHHAGVDDAHGHARFDGVIQKHRVDRFARRVVAAERKTHVRYATADFGVRQVVAYPLGGLYEIHRVVAVFLDTRGNREYIRIENNVFGREAYFLRQQIVGALADFSFALEGIRLALLIKRHHNHRRAVALAQRGLAQKLGFTFFHADGVDHRLALHAL